MIQLSCNVCQILPWVLRSKKSQLYKIHTTLHSRDKGQNNKRSLTLWTGVKFSSSSDFNENGLKLIRLPCRFRKCKVLYTLNVPNLVKEGSKFNGHGPYMGIDLWPLDSHTSWLPRYANINLLIWPLSQERNIVWISCKWILCSLWPKEEFDMHYNLIEACWLFWYHVALPPPPPVTPVHLTDLCVHPRSVH